MYPRVLKLNDALKPKSIFLFGPRATGKTHLYNHQLDNPLIFDLLKPSTFHDLTRQPTILEERIRAESADIVVIDEVQKLPWILDEVHRLIECIPGVRFLLTGSSARKLKRGGGRTLWQGGHGYRTFTL